MSRIPDTYYLLSYSGVIQGEFTSMFEIAMYIGITVEGEYIYVKGKKQLPQYSIGEDRNSFTPEEAIIDWMKYHRKLPYGTAIRRCLNYV